MSPEGLYAPYPRSLDETRKTEYAHLGDAVYLDHAGATPYAASVIHRQAQDLTSTLYGNPHSASQASQRVADKIAGLRTQALQMLHVEGYDLVFTSGATAAIKLVGELMSSSPEWHYSYAQNSHTSLIGLRELATSWAVDGPPIGLTLSSWSARCNATGDYTDLRSRLMQHYGSNKRQDVFTLYDAASLVASSPLNLSAHNGPDFIVFSFSKLFGYPTGLGALLVKQCARTYQRVQMRRYFGGGTVDAVASMHAFRAFKQDISSALEDGTLPFHNILALEHAMAVHAECYGQDFLFNIHLHVQSLNVYARSRLMHMYHTSGEPLVRLLSKQAGSPILSMLLHRSDGSPIGYAEVAALASLLGFHIRAGTLCNPGLLTLLDFSSEEIRANHAAGHVCSDQRDVIDGKPTGAVRISFGAMTTHADIDAFIAFLRDYFLESEPPIGTSAKHSPAVLSKLNVYPVKSCKGYSVPANKPWRVLPSGLQYDRQWAIVNLDTRQVLSQKRHTRMALIAPKIMEETLQLEVGIDTISVPLAVKSSKLSQLTCNVCGEDASILIYSDPAIEKVLTAFLGVRCTLSVADPSASRSAKLDSPGSWSSLSTGDQQRRRVQLLLSNESPFLCISQSSVAAVAREAGIPVDAAVFRANFELSGLPAFAEDVVKQVQVGESRFAVLGRCRRCLMICINQETGERTKEPYATLTRMRKSGGRLWFGIHLDLEAGTMVQVGDQVPYQ